MPVLCLESETKNKWAEKDNFHCGSPFYALLANNVTQSKTKQPYLRLFFTWLLWNNRSRSGSVGILSRLRDKRSLTHSSRCRETDISVLGLLHIISPTEWTPGFFPGVKWPANKVNHSLSLIQDVKIEGICTSRTIAPFFLAKGHLSISSNTISHLKRVWPCIF